jgi:hypothetical protein
VKAAVLCNGPSRKLYGEIKYDYVIGCNFPWTTVDATVVLDIDIIRKWSKDLSMIQSPVYFSSHAWSATDKRMRAKIKHLFKGVMEQEMVFDSCGHAATRKVIELGYDEIDVYGCDSYFENKIDSYTHQYVANISPQVMKQMVGWRERWNKMILNNPSIKINIIGNIHD